MDSGEHQKAIRIYLFISDGDSSLEGGFHGEQLGICYEALGDLNAAKYWYGRAVEENPEVRVYSRERRKALEQVDIIDLVPNYLVD